MSASRAKGGVELRADIEALQWRLARLRESPRTTWTQGAVTCFELLLEQRQRLLKKSVKVH